MVRLVLILGMIIALVSGCRKTKEKNLQASKDYALILHDLSYVVPLAIHTVQSESYLLERLRTGMDTLTSCASYIYLQGDTTDISQDPIQFEILFNQCSDVGEGFKNGSLKCILYDYFNVDSASCLLLFDAFSINDNIISGSLDIKRINGDTYKVVTSNLKVIVETREIKYDGTWQYQISTGQDIDLLNDNDIFVSDNGTLIDRYGVESLVNNQGVRRELQCRWFSSGIVEIESSEDQSQFLDFGTGECENSATVTLAEEEVSISL